MKRIFTYNILAVCAFALALPSCSFMQQTQKKITTGASAILRNDNSASKDKAEERLIPDDEPMPVTQPVVAPKEVYEPAVAEDTKPETKTKTKPETKDEVKTEVVTFPDPENEDPIKPETPVNINKRIGGEWLIVKVGTTAIEPSDEMPYITFAPAEDRFYSSNGCNIINGDYFLAPDMTLTLSNVLQTMKFCGDLGYDSEISVVLSGASELKLKKVNVGHETELRFYNLADKEVMVARRHNMDFLNGNWTISSINGKKTESDRANIFIDINELKVHGNTGCNYFNGQIFINPEKSNAIDFNHIACTRMACPDMEIESAILLALEEVSTAIQSTDGNVMFLDASGNQLMTLTPASLQAE